MDQLSTVKEFAIKTLDCFDELAKPEIKNRVMLRVWNYIKNYSYKIILRKPDEELRNKLRSVYDTLGPLFNETSLSVEIHKGESLGSPKIPEVGELAKVKKLTSPTKAEEILKELKL